VRGEFNGRFDLEHAGAYITWRPAGRFEPMWLCNRLQRVSFSTATWIFSAVNRKTKDFAKCQLCAEMRKQPRFRMKDDVLFRWLNVLRQLSGYSLKKYCQTRKCLQIIATEARMRRHLFDLIYLSFARVQVQKHRNCKKGSMKDYSITWLDFIGGYQDDPRCHHISDVKENVRAHEHDKVQIRDTGIIT